MSKIKYVDELVSDVIKDYESRRERRRSYELTWRLCLSFIAGDQYSYISSRGNIENSSKRYFWQSREVFNRIAPILESRLSKLQRVRPTVTVRSYTDSEEDIASANRSELVLGATFERINFPKLINEATIWSESCGTAFYKIQWDTESGIALPDNPQIKVGDLSVEVVSPFEIFPDSDECSDLEDCMSVIHARPLSLAAINNIYGFEVSEKYTFIPSANFYTPSSSNAIPSALVIEKYEAPSRDLPEGRLIIVVGDRLVYAGNLPYACGENGKRTYPFVKQLCVKVPGSFWGRSVVERLIPVQRSYNAVKNRKMEYLNRIISGVLAVEEGSVNSEELEEDGLYPGKLLVYRQGAALPEFLKEDPLPSSFRDEEEALIKEFVSISNNPDIMSSGESTVRLASGTALSLIIEQDIDKLSHVAENIRCAIKETAKQMLRIFKQYANLPRNLRRGDTKEILLLKGNDITDFDVVLTAESEQTLSASAQRAALLELYNSGLLFNEQGKLPESVRKKLLTSMNFENLIDKGEYDNAGK